MSFFVISKKSANSIYTKSFLDDPEIDILEFSTEIEARNYLKTGNKHTICDAPKISPGSPISQDPIQVFTDGACSNNGKPNAKAGIGIYVPNFTHLNKSLRITGKQTNNAAELYAVISVFPMFNKNERVIIYTDSEYVIKCATTYGEKCSNKNWPTTIPNYSLVKQIYELFKANPQFELFHIKAHTNKNDNLSKGNAEADRLAVMSIT